jgi:hypothetical protein
MCGYFIRCHAAIKFTFLVPREMQCVNCSTTPHCRLGCPTTHDSLSRLWALSFRLCVTSAGERTHDMYQTNSGFEVERKALQVP